MGRLVRAKGLEPPRLAPPEPKSGVSTSFTTPAGREAAGLAQAARAGKACTHRDQGNRVKASRAKASISFLKKRSKKLLSLRLCRRSAPHGTVSGSINKSFLVLFFKNELLPSFTRWPWRRGAKLGGRTPALRCPAAAMCGLGQVAYKLKCICQTDKASCPLEEPPAQSTFVPPATALIAKSEAKLTPGK